MANDNKNIVITPNIGSSTDDPKIVFSGADSSTSAQNITLYAYPTDNGTISFEGSAGQLFSITNSLTGSIFSVNDVSGIPSIEVFDTGEIRLAEFSGNVLVGTATDNGSDKLQVDGSLIANTINASLDLRAPIFYDSENTGYYVDPAGTSNINVLNVADINRDPVITLTGDVTGSGTMTNLGSVSITTTVADDSHNHVISNVDGLQTALDGKQPTGSYLTTSSSFSGDVSGTYNNIVVADDSHNHVISNVDGLQTALDGKLPLAGGTMTGTLNMGTQHIQMQESHYINRRFELIENASPQWILLCRNTANNDVNGTIQMDRTSANYQAPMIDVIVSSGTAAMFGGCLRTLQVLQSSEDYRLVSVTYDGASWIAIKYTGNPYLETTGAYFTGRIVTSAGTPFTVVSSGITNEASFGGNSESYNEVDSFVVSGSITAGSDLAVSGGDIVLGGTGRIQGIDTVSAATDAVNKTYVDTNYQPALVSGTNIKTVGGTSLLGSGDVAVSSFPAGTLMLFQQTTAPTGWTKQTSHDNKALRVVSGTAGSGGSVSFTSAFASYTPSGSVSVSLSGGGVSASSLTVAQLASHRHTAAKYSGSGVAKAWQSVPSSSADRYTGYTGSNSTHTHGYTRPSGSGSFTGTARSFAVQYVDLIIASKD